MKAAGQVWVFFNTETQQQTQPMSYSKAQFFILQLKPHELRSFVAWTPGWEKWRTIRDILKNDSQYFPTPPPVKGQKSEDVIDVVAKKTTRKVNDDATVTQSRVRSKTVTIKVNNPNLGEHTYTEIALHNSTPEINTMDFQPDGVNWDHAPSAPVLSKNPTCELKDDERREYKRFPHRIEVVLMTKKGRSFRSSSQNISLGGALLREPIPSELLNDVMDLVVVNPFPDKETPSHLLVKGRVVSDSNDRRRLMFYDVSPEVQKKLQLILENYKKNYAQFKKKKAA